MHAHPRRGDAACRVSQPERDRRLRGAQLRDPRPRPHRPDDDVGIPELDRDPQAVTTRCSRGSPPDQSALYGVINQLEALGLQLLEISRPQFDDAEPSDQIT